MKVFGYAKLIYIVAAALLFAGCAKNTDTLYCQLCGAEKLEVDEFAHDHGVGNCVQQAQCRIKGHYTDMERTTDTMHEDCGICGKPLCTGTHGEGRCEPPATPAPLVTPTPESTPFEYTVVVTPAPAPTPTPEPTPEPTERPRRTPTPDPNATPTPTPTPTPYAPPTPTPTPDPNATPTPTPEPTPTPTPTPVPTPYAPPTPTPEPTPTPSAGEQQGGGPNGDWTLEDFYVTLDNGRRYNLSDLSKRAVTCKGVSRATVTAVPRSSSAKVSGDVGSITVGPGLNRYRVFVTSVSGQTADFNFTITNQE